MVVCTTILKLQINIKEKKPLPFSLTVRLNENGEIKMNFGQAK